MWFFYNFSINVAFYELGYEWVMDSFMNGVFFNAKLQRLEIIGFTLI